MNYNHININERSCIYQFLTLGMSIRGIAKALHRSPSTISREIKRNSYRAWSNFKEHDRYFPVKAQEKYEERTSKNVTPAIIEALGKLPSELVKTITFDRGKEFAEYEKIEAALGCKTYFCDPYCAWQKGTNENTNGLLREFYPKGMDLFEVDPEELKKNLNLMNNRPRKCIKYKTPKEELLGNSS